MSNALSNSQLLKGKPIAMTRGDKQIWGFTLFDAEKKTITDTPAAIYFTVKNKFTDEAAVLQKTLDNGISVDENYYYTITISPEDTESLEYGRYVYDVEVILDAEGKNKHTLAANYLTLGSEATWAENEEAE